MPDAESDESTPTEPLRVGILLFDGVEPLDAIGPAQVFWSLETARQIVPIRPVELLLVAERVGPVTMGHGLVVQAPVDYATCPPLDVLIVPGGTGNEETGGGAALGRRFQARHPATIEFVRAQDAHTAVSASVCTGTFILGGAGVLDGHRGNTHWYARDELVEFMAERGERFELVIERVVDDGHVVSAGGVSSGIELALHLVERFLGAPARDTVSAIIERETPGIDLLPA